MTKKDLYKLAWEIGYEFDNHWNEAYNEEWSQTRTWWDRTKLVVTSRLDKRVAFREIQQRLDKLEKQNLDTLTEEKARKFLFQPFEERLGNA